MNSTARKQSRVLATGRRTRAISITIAIAAIVWLLTMAVSPAMAQARTIVVVAPHPDDEGLCCSGVIYNAVQKGYNVKVVVVTNGDFYTPGMPLGLQREAETVAAMALLGVPEQNVIFMGYGDEALETLYQSTSPTQVYTSQAGQSQTYANRGLGGVSYHQYLTGSPGQYNRQTILSDMQAMLQNLQPNDVYTTGLWDDHPDHHTTFNFVVEALLALRKQGSTLSTRVHESLVHSPCLSCGTANNANYIWPGGGQGISPVFTPTAPMPQPYYLENVWPNGDSTPYSWNQIEVLPVPAPMQVTTQSANLKSQVIAQYYSQDGANPNDYLFSFAKKNEFFWVRDFGTNIAGLATVTVSSQTPGTGQLGTSAVDGFIEGDPGYMPWEWVTQGQLGGAWITLTWPTPMTISQVVLYNRQNRQDDITSGSLIFSDGSRVSVGQLPLRGNGTLVSFTPRTVTSVQFAVTTATGQNIGLTEIEVFGKKQGTQAGHPQIYQGPTASATYVTDQYGQLLYPSITDAQTTNLSVTAFDVDNFTMSYAWTADAGVMSGSGSTVLFSPPTVASQSLVTGTVTVSDGHGGTAVNNIFIAVRPSNGTGINVSSLTLSPTTVASGNSSTGTVRLNAIASRGAILNLTSSNPSVASVPATVTVAPGARTATFPVNTTFVTTTTNVTISANLGTTANAVLTVQQPSTTLSSFSVNPTTVGGGGTATGTVGLSAPAPTGGSVVTLTSSAPQVTVPASVTVAAGQTTANFTATTQAVGSPVVATLAATFVGQQRTSTLRVAPGVPANLAGVATVTVSSETPAYQQLGIKAIDGIVDGSPGDYTKEWATNGQLAGAWINLAWNLPVTISEVDLYDRPNPADNVTAGNLTFSDQSTVQVGTLPNDGSILRVTFSPRTVTSLKFNITGAVGQNIGLAEIAVVGSITQASSITSVSLNPSTVNGGSASTGTVMLNGVAPAGGTVVALSSSNPSIASVPATVTVPSGSMSATFPVTTNPVSVSTAVTITGTYNGTQTAILVVNPVALSSLTLNPTMVTGGSGTSTGLVTLSAPAPTGGAVVTLTSSNGSLATVPVSVTVPAQGTSATFTVTTSPVTSATAVTISGTYNGTQSATLWVTPVISGGGGMQQFVTDSFNRGNGSLGNNWSTILDSPSVATLVNQQVQSPWVYSTALYYGGISWPADQYAAVQVVQSNGGSSGPSVRMTSTGNYYAGTVGDLGNGNASVYIILDNGGNRSIIASSSSATVLANDYLQLSVQGTTLTLSNVTRSLTLLTVSDATLAVGYPGVYVGSGSIVANWSAGLNAAPLTLSTLATDSFNRANAPNLGSNWAVGPGYYSIQIINNQIESAGQGQPPGAGHGKEYYVATPFTSDQWSQAQVISSTNDVNGAIVRYQGSVDTHYVGFVSMVGQPGTCTVTIDRDINGAPAVLASDSTFCTVSSGDFVRLQAQGNLLTFVNATTGALLLTTTDSQITGGSPGWSLGPSGGTPTADSWSGGGFSH